MPRVVLVFDADAGGDTGVDRALQLFASQDMELSIATLPAGLDPCDLLVKDGPEPFPVRIHEAEGDERDTWWQRAVAAFPPYAEYQERTERVIPVLIATRAG